MLYIIIIIIIMITFIIYIYLFIFISHIFPTIRPCKCHCSHVKIEDFSSMEGKTRHQLWMDLCDLVGHWWMAHPVNRWTIKNTLW